MCSSWFIKDRQRIATNISIFQRSRKAKLSVTFQRWNVGEGGTERGTATGRGFLKLKNETLQNPPGQVPPRSEEGGQLGLEKSVVA